MRDAMILKLKLKTLPNHQALHSLGAEKAQKGHFEGFIGPRMYILLVVDQ